MLVVHLNYCNNVSQIPNLHKSNIDSTVYTCLPYYNYQKLCIWLTMMIIYHNDDHIPQWWSLYHNDDHIAQWWSYSTMMIIYHNDDHIPQWWSFYHNDDHIPKWWSYSTMMIIYHFDNTTTMKYNYSYTVFILYLNIKTTSIYKKSSLWQLQKIFQLTL